MSKKIFDIIPPNLASNVEARVRNLMGEKPTKKKTKKDKKKKKLGRLAGVLVFLGVFLVLTIIYLYFSLASLSVEIWPVTEAVNFEQKIIIEEALKEIDFENKKVPAQFIEEEKELRQEFTATGSKLQEGIAQGTVRVYNKYTPATPLTLVARTRFLSDSGKLFRSVSKINIPAAQIKNGKVTPGWVDVRIEAAEAGEDYNIGSATFSIPGLAGTAYYYSLYAESTESMAGGHRLELKVVTAEDIESAKDNLTQKLFNDIEESLKNKALSSNLVFFSDAVSKKTIESSCSAKAGSEADGFSCTMKTKVSALVAKGEDLRRIAKDYVFSQIPNFKTILEETLTLVYTPELVDLSSGTATFNSRILADTYPIIDIQAMSLAFRKKNSNQISDIIYNEFGQEISRIKINFWPFWVREAPKDQGKIRVQLKFE